MIEIDGHLINLRNVTWVTMQSDRLLVVFTGDSSLSFRWLHRRKFTREDAKEAYCEIKEHLIRMMT